MRELRSLRWRSSEYTTFFDSPPPEVEPGRRRNRIPARTDTNNGPGGSGFNFTSAEFRRHMGSLTRPTAPGLACPESCSICTSQRIRDATSSPRPRAQPRDQQQPLSTASSRSASPAATHAIAQRRDTERIRNYLGYRSLRHISQDEIVDLMNVRGPAALRSQRQSEQAAESEARPGSPNQNHETRHDSAGADVNDQPPSQSAQRASQRRSLRRIPRGIPRSLQERAAEGSQHHVRDMDFTPERPSVVHRMMDSFRWFHVTRPRLPSMWTRAPDTAGADLERQPLLPESQDESLPQSASNSGDPAYGASPKGSKCEAPKENGFSLNGSAQQDTAARPGRRSTGNASGTTPTLPAPNAGNEPDGEVAQVDKDASAQQKENETPRNAARQSAVHKSEDDGRNQPQQPASDAGTDDSTPSPTATTPPMPVQAPNTEPRPQIPDIQASSVSSQACLASQALGDGSGISLGSRSVSSRPVSDWRGAHAYSQGTPDIVRRNRERYDSPGLTSDDSSWQGRSLADDTRERAENFWRKQCLQEIGSILHEMAQVTDEQDQPESPNTEALRTHGHALSDISNFVTGDTSTSLTSGGSAVPFQGSLNGTDEQEDDCIRDLQDVSSDDDEELLMSGALDGMQG
ncbi:hypothetical protein AC578_3944 [Pseudocercospora eumusae]|uniref:Uncharacterized protein n=1 Tax=Pseudocercospora eumusae TaxID=321146 RepID=A0A139HLU3_9PEZI|nr:hypothetical protein AC578_3944 [Pseudocercospora eumusae]